LTILVYRIEPNEKQTTVQIRQLALVDIFAMKTRSCKTIFRNIELRWRWCNFYYFYRLQYISRGGNNMEIAVLDSMGVI